jgi:hypothetical protein
LGASSRPFLVKATRRAVMWHPEQIKVCCSKPRIATVCSGTTFINIISALHAVQCIARTPLVERPPIVASIEHFQRNLAVSRCGETLSRLIFCGAHGPTSCKALRAYLLLPTSYFLPPTGYSCACASQPDSFAHGRYGVGGFSGRWQMCRHTQLSALAPRSSIRGPVL